MLEGEDFFRSSGLIDVPDERGIFFILKKNKKTKPETERPNSGPH